MSAPIRAFGRLWAVDVRHHIGTYSRFQRVPAMWWRRYAYDALALRDGAVGFKQLAGIFVSTTPLNGYIFLEIKKTCHALKRMCDYGVGVCQLLRLL